MKKKLFKLLNFLKKDNTKSQLTRIGVSAAALAVIICLFFTESFSELVATAVSLSATALVLYSGKVLLSLFEDWFKISRDTAYLLGIYKEGDGISDYEKIVTLNGTDMTIAYDDVFVNTQQLPMEQFRVVDDPSRQFRLEGFIEGNFAQLYSAHSNSFKMNGDTIRLDDYRVVDGKHTFFLSRSTYYNHLVTNRVADFVLFDDVTLRSMYEYHSHHTPLPESKMSNHVGVNALVYLSDGNLLIPQRDKDSTISKNKVTSSIAVMLNFPENGQMVDTRHLLHGTIMDNLCKRVRLHKADCPEEQVEVKFLGFGRNVYEAGKPQFYYEVHLKNIDTKTYRELTDQWERNNKNRLDVDKYIHVADPKTMCFQKGKLFFADAENKGKTYLLEYEMSYLCNLWQAAAVKGQVKDPKEEHRKAEQAQKTKAEKQKKGKKGKRK